MRIVFFTAFAVPHRGGVEHYALALARILVKRGHRVTIFTCNTDDALAHEFIDGVEFVRLPAWNFASRFFPVPLPTLSAVRALRTLRASPPDIVCTHTRFYITSLVGLAVARWLRRPLFHVEHGSRVFRSEKRLVTVMSWLVDHSWGRIVVRRANRLFAVSEPVVAFLESLGRRDAVVLHNRIDASVFHPSEQLRTTWRRELGVREDQVVAVFCGRMVITKGILDLQEAFGDVSAEHALLVYVGAGPDLSRIVETNRVRCLGELDTGGIVGVLNAADIFVHPSYHPEGLPTSVLEAGAVGLPVIATDAGGTPEIISSREEGVLIAQRDVPGLSAALERLLQDRELRVKLGRAIRERVLQRFTWNEEVESVFLADSSGQS